MALTIALAFVIAALLYGLIQLGARRIIFQPSRYPKGWWDLQAELGTQDVWLRASDGVRLHAWWVQAPTGSLATLYLHGNGGNLSNRPEAVRDLPAAGSSVLLLDYRGYGRSAGTPTLRGIRRDADAGYDYLTQQGYQTRQIVIHGESLGCAVAVDLAARHPCAALILQSPFTSLSDMAARVVPVIGPLFVRGFDSRRKIAEVHAPVWIIHGDQDRTVPYAMGRALFEAAQQPKAFWTVERAGHDDLVEVAGPLYRERMREFYASLPR
jgi:uncharacterized protein